MALNVEYIQIGAYNTFDDFGLIPQEPLTLAPFEVKTNYIDIPYFSKRYDFTEALQGSTPYGPSEGEWAFYKIGGKESDHKTISDALHGKSFVISFKGTQYTGRVAVSEWVNHEAPDPVYAECVISYNIDPPNA